MWVLVGDKKDITNRLGLDETNALVGWQVASAEEPLPSASVYLDLSGCFARERPSNTPSDAWWFVHAPGYTLAELPAHSIRLNAWPGFASGKDWEMAWSGPAAEKITKEVCASLQKNPIEVPDQIGMIGGRVLLSILNEAFLLLGEGSANRHDIDLAMKLGTNYPFGPFEWGEKIGWKEAYSILKRLAETDARYEPATAWDDIV
jgi:3-hydroxybutyryl-CoA dehydrogenase